MKTQDPQLVTVRCGQCSTGRFETRAQVNGWTCGNCGHEIVPADLVDVDEVMTVDGVLVIRDASL